jgi:pyruvate-formate lyase-activating enzyme
MKIDGTIRRAFGRGAGRGVTVSSVKADGLSLRVTFSGQAGRRLDLMLCPSGLFPSTDLATPDFDILLPPGSGGAEGRADRRMLETVLGVLRRLSDRLPRRLDFGDWMETLGDEVERPFLCGPTVEIKLTRRCNQACVFCKTPREANNFASPDMVPHLLRRLSSRADSVTLSGGEPCLEPSLEDHIREAREAGFSLIEVQTNGVLMEDEAYVQRLRRAGMTNVLVSFHSHLPEISDAITRSPGGHGSTLRCLDRLMRTDLYVTVCHVLCSLNYRHVPAYVEFLKNRFSYRLNSLLFSLAIPTYRVRQDPGLMPRLTDLVRPLKQGLDMCHPRGVPVRLPRIADSIDRAESLVPRGPLSGPLHGTLNFARRMLAKGPLRASVISHCGIPLCLMEGYEHFHDDYWDEGTWDEVHDLYRPGACRGCRWESRCAGIWRLYAERYGEDEVRPVR